MGFNCIKKAPPENYRKVEVLLESQDCHHSPSNEKEN